MQVPSAGGVFHVAAVTVEPKHNSGQTSWFQMLQIGEGRQTLQLAIEKSAQSKIKQELIGMKLAKKLQARIFKPRKCNQKILAF